MVTISLCMIVKNEEQRLEQCLKSIEGIPDEIIIIDTGSTDRTIEVATQWTNHVYNFSWIDDFSAARNKSFSYATQEYIFWLDADDILEAREVLKLKMLKKNLKPSVDAVSMRYYISFDDNNMVTSSTRRIRLVKREKSFKWYGIVHEDLACPTPFEHEASDIIVTHTKKKPKDALRNLKIYKHAIRRGHKLSINDLFHYARELTFNKEYEEAIKIYQTCLENDSEFSLENQVLIYHQLATCYYFVNKPEKEKELTLQSFLVDIPQPVFCCRMGELFIQKHQYEQAIFWYKLAIAIEIPTRYEWSISQQVYQTWLPHKQLGMCYYYLGDYDMAYMHNQHVLKYKPNDVETISNLNILKEIGIKK